MSDRTRIVAGVMSGTSADGINVALVRIAQPGSSKRRGRLSPRHIVELLGHAEYPYSPRVRAAVLAAMNAEQTSVAELARLNFLLGELYAEAVLSAQRKFRLNADLVGCHGQTIYHQGEAANFLGKKITTTWQTGEAAVIAARVGVPVVSDFRPADMAAGGKGAPLVPYLDYLLFRDDEVGRIVQNIGGIANLTAIPACAGIDDVTAFDTGPGNMVIDQVMEKLFHRTYDHGGQIAASGKVLEHIVSPLLKRGFFRQRPPKTAGREEFGREFVREFLQACGRARKQDVVATATALTARSIALAIHKFVIGTKSRDAFSEIILSGGGARNATLLEMLSDSLLPMGVSLRISDDFGLPSQAKEAVAFAVLAYETWHRRASNVPSATGAKRPAILGKISYA
ncbi:MAG: anhydro-N-acetylmuramic acid kinase [Candidatus Sulfotelmatobacter sp.]